MSPALAALRPAGPASPSQPWDEMVDGSGGLRPRWSSLLGTFSGLGRDTLLRRVAQLERIFTEEGVTGLLPGATPVAWRCDPLPLILGAGEFAELEAGLAQRASLLDAVLADVYGEQGLLQAGALPPALVYANPAFLRPCRRRPGARSGAGAGAGVGGEAGPPRLRLYAAELLRLPDGSWRVAADRTADAAGIAYAQENRRALARVVPEIFRLNPPRRLTPFFAAWQEALQRLAPSGEGSSGFALLTPGPGDKLWFEHVVLARELSCTLVESGDLTVRDGVLYLKTLRGLERVNVLIRRQDGRSLDPLELDAHPGHGVTGLLDAARSGAVCIVNDPGAGFAEAPALAAFLPGLARRLLGEELLLPGVPSLWLGDPTALDTILPELAEWRIRPALDGTVPATNLAGLSAEQRAELVAQVRAAPGDFVATAVTAPSVAPCVGPDGFAPLPIVLRMFLMFDGERWRALPGGLARVLSEEDLASGRLPLHTMTKDVWVGSEDDADEPGPVPLLPPPLAVRRTSGDLPSRVADNFFWLGRTLERLEASARLLRMTLDRLLRPNLTPREHAELRLLAGALVEAGLLRAEDTSLLSFERLGETLLQLARPEGELTELLDEVSRLAELLRDRLTREVYATVSHGLHGLSERLDALRHGTPSASGSHETLHGITGVILTFAATVAGLAAENMVRGGGRLFLDLGRRLERSWATARAMACFLGQSGPAEPGLLLSLELCDSLITYRNRYLTTLQPGPVLDLAVADAGNPRALAFQVQAVGELLAGLSAAAEDSLQDAAAALMRDVQALAHDTRSLADGAASTVVPPRLRALEQAIAALSNAISRRYFALLPAAHRLDETAGTPDKRGAA